MPKDESQQVLRAERAARARAARAFAGLNQKAVADALGVSDITVKRLEAGSREISMDALWVIADLCGVPREFMVHGFDSVPEHLKELHGRFDALEAKLGWTAAQAIAGEALARLGGEPELPGLERPKVG